MKKLILPALLGLAFFAPTPSRALPVDDVVNGCLEFKPAAAQPLAIAPLNLDVALLADRGVTTARAQTILSRAATAYAPLGITLRASSLEHVNFTGTTASALLAESKAKFGGQRPAGSDIVALITSVDFDGAVLGQADCIGGVRFPKNAFFVMEDPAITLGISDGGLRIGPIAFYVDVSGKTFAHEAGHLMGAHHHYANCAEGKPSFVGDVATCSLMTNVVDFMALNFGTLESAIVRGHADAYARP